MKRARRVALSKPTESTQSAQNAGVDGTADDGRARFQKLKAVRWHRRDADAVVFAVSGKDFPSTHVPESVSKGPIPRLEPDILLELAEGEPPSADGTGGAPAHLVLIRAVVRAELPAGTLSCQDEFAKLPDYRWLASPNLYLRTVSSVEAAADAYEVEHLEVSFRDQFVSRSDMLEVSLALSNRAVFVGQEVYVTGFTFTVCRMIRAKKRGQVAEEPQPVDRRDHMASVTDLTDLLAMASTPTRAGASQGAPTGGDPSAAGGDASSQQSQSCNNGLVTPRTHVSFESLSFATTCLFCVSSELDNVMPDGRSGLDWATDGLLADYTRQLAEEYGAFPKLRVVLFGVLAHAETSRDNFITTATSPNSTLNPLDLAHEVKRQVMLFRKRVADSVSLAATSDFSLFAPASHSNFLDAVNVALERFGKHGINRVLHMTGHSLFVVTAGKGRFCIGDVQAAELTARRIHDIGIKTCTVVCMGRPPLHATPLFEFSGTDRHLANQRNLRVDRRRLYYAQPKWITCMFYHVSQRRDGFASRAYDLYTRKQWHEEFDNPDAAGQHGALLFSVPRDATPGCHEFTLGVPPSDLAYVPIERSAHFSRVRGAAPATTDEFTHDGLGSGTHSVPISPSLQPDAHPGGSFAAKHAAQPGSNPSSGDTRPREVLTATWTANAVDSDTNEPQELVALLDSDIATSHLNLHLSISPRLAADGTELHWNPAVCASEAAWSDFLDAFSCRFGTSGFVRRRADILRRPPLRSLQGGDMWVNAWPCPDIAIEGEEEVIFEPRPDFFINPVTGQPLATFADVGLPTAPCITVCYVSPQWATVFTFQPVHPYTGDPGKPTRQSYDELMTNDAMLNRWAYRFPSRTRARDHVNWDTLCRCPLMPIRCPPETVILNQLSFTSQSYDRFFEVALGPQIFMEMVFQRLSQGFQLVSLTDEHAAKLTMGHQTHTVALSKNTGQITVSTTQHRGVWCMPAQRTRQVCFKRWNYLTKSFESCAGELGAQIGVGRSIVHWDHFDDEVLRRQRILDMDKPTRNIAYAMVPADPRNPLDATELYKFLDGRFSTMLTRAVEDEKIPYFKERESSDVTCPIPVDLSLAAPSTLVDGCTVPVHAVRLVQPPTSDKIVALHRRRFAGEIGVQAPRLSTERGMFVNVLLSDDFDPRCCFIVRASWTICTGSVLADWDSHIRLVAPDHGFNVFRIPRTRFEALGSLDALPTATIEWSRIRGPRERIIQFVCHTLLYRPERVPVIYGTRLIHCSGLAIVIVEESGVVWGENPLMPTGTETHLALWHAFLRAVRIPQPDDTDLGTAGLPAGMPVAQGGEEDGVAAADVVAMDEERPGPPVADDAARVSRRDSSSSPVVSGGALTRNDSSA